MKTFNYHSTNLHYSELASDPQYSNVEFQFSQQYVIRDDVNGDGYLDIVNFPNLGNEPLIEEPRPKPIAWIWEPTTGKYVDQSETIFENWDAVDLAFVRDIAQGDFDGDGDQDYVLLDPGFENRTLYPIARNKPGGELHYIENTDSGLRWADEVFDQSSRSFNHIGDTADFDGDGDIDIGIAKFEHRTANAPHIAVNNGDGTWTIETDMFSGNPAKPVSGMGFVELADGRTAIAAGFYFNENANTENQLWVYNNNTQQFESYDTYKQIPNRGAVDHVNIDVNNDGLKDLVVMYEGYIQIDNRTNDHYQVLLQNENSEFVEHQIITNAAGNFVSGHLQFDDLNQDGYVDFIIDKWRIEFHNDPEWQQAHGLFYINNGDGSFRQATNTNFNFTPVDGEFAYSENGVQLTDGVEEHNLNMYHDVNNDGLVDLIQFGQETPVDTGWWEDSVGERATVYLGSLTMQQLVDDVEHEPLSSDQGWVVKLIDTLFTDQEQQQFGLVQTGVDFLNQGMSKQEIAAAAASFTSGDDSSVLMHKIWKELFGTEISTGDLAYWSNAIDSGVYSQGDIALLAVDYYNLGTASLSNLFYS